MPATAAGPPPRGGHGRRRAPQQQYSLQRGWGFTGPGRQHPESHLSRLAAAPGAHPLGPTPSTYCPPLASAPDAFAADPAAATWATPPSDAQRGALPAALASCLAAHGVDLAAPSPPAAAPGLVRFLLPATSPAAQALGQQLDGGRGALSVAVLGNTAHVPVRRASRGGLPPRCVRVIIDYLPTAPVLAVQGVTAAVLRCAGYVVGDPQSARPQPYAAMVPYQQGGGLDYTSQAPK